MKKLCLSFITVFMIILGFNSCEKTVCYECERVTGINSSDNMQIVKIDVCDGNIRSMTGHLDTLFSTVDANTGSANQYRQTLENGDYSCVDK